MKRLALVAIALLLVCGVAVAQEKMETDKKAATKTETGTIKSITSDSLTITRGTQDWTFMIDKSTTIVGKGGTTKTREAKEQGKTGITATEMLKEKQRVRVKYHDMGGKLHAAEVTIM